MPAGRKRVALCALAAAAFLAVGPGDLLSAHTCPHHDEPPVGHGAAGLPSSAVKNAGHQGHEDHHGQGDHASPTDSPWTGAPGGDRAADPHGHDDGLCTCPGDCQISGAAPSVAVVGIDRDAPTLRLPRLRASSGAPALAPLPYRLPWANAPPRST
jgi:hypothetical protein